MATFDTDDYLYKATILLNSLYNKEREPKYKIVLEFMNSLLFPIKEFKYKSLSDIRYVYEEDILNNGEHNDKVVEEYEVKIKEMLNVSYPKKTREGAILIYIGRVLKKLDYEFSRSTKYKKPTYNVVRRLD